MRRKVFTVGEEEERDPFGLFLETERDRLGFTQLELARRLKMSSDKSVRAWEKGDQRPQADNLAELGRVFGWDFNRVMSYLGAPDLDGVERIATAIKRRPLLERLLGAARLLSDTDLEPLVLGIEGLRAARLNARNSKGETGLAGSS